MLENETRGTGEERQTEVEVYHLHIDPQNRRISTVLTPWHHKASSYRCLRHANALSLPFTGAANDFWLRSIQQVLLSALPVSTQKHSEFNQTVVSPAFPSVNPPPPVTGETSQVWTIRGLCNRKLLVFPFDIKTEVLISICCRKFDCSVTVLLSPKV